MLYSKYSRTVRVTGFTSANWHQPPALSPAGIQGRANTAAMYQLVAIGNSNKKDLPTEGCFLHDNNVTAGDERACLGANCVPCQAVAALDMVPGMKSDEIFLL